MLLKKNIAIHHVLCVGEECGIFLKDKAEKSKRKIEQKKETE